MKSAALFLLAAITRQLVDFAWDNAYRALSFVLGAATSAAIAFVVSRRQEQERFRNAKRVEYLEQQLSRLYWPLYLHLQKDNLIWQKLLDRQRDSNDDRSKLSQHIERDVILPNHRDAVKTIEANIHLAGDSQIVDACLRYVKHVKVYEALRAANIPGDPLNFGEPYPSDVFDLIERRTRSLQDAYDELIQRSTLLVK